MSLVTTTTQALNIESHVGVTILAHLVQADLIHQAPVAQEAIGPGDVELVQVGRNFVEARSQKPIRKILKWL